MAKNTHDVRAPDVGVIARADGYGPICFARGWTVQAGKIEFKLEADDRG
jgi:hypothetical protein